MSDNLDHVKESLLQANYTDEIELIIQYAYVAVLNECQIFAFFKKNL